MGIFKKTGEFFCKNDVYNDIVDSMDDPKLKPCPFCGSSEVELDMYVGIEGFYYSVSCHNCGCKLWGKNTEKKAIDLWNTRL